MIVMLCRVRGKAASLTRKSGERIKGIAEETLNKKVRGRIAALRGARSLASLLDRLRSCAPRASCFSSRSRLFP